MLCSSNDCFRFRHVVWWLIVHLFSWLWNIQVYWFFLPCHNIGNVRCAPPPASEKEDDDNSVIIQPSQSSLASKLPQSSFSFKVNISLVLSITCCLFSRITILSVFLTVSALKCTKEGRLSLQERDDSGYNELPKTPENGRPSECDLRRQMRRHLGIASDDSNETDDVIIEEEYYVEEDDVMIEEEEGGNKNKYSPPFYPPGLAPLSAPPGINARPFFPIHPSVPQPLPPGGIWVPVMCNPPPPSAPPFYPSPIGFFPPPGLIRLPPPMMLLPPLPPPPDMLPPGLPPPLMSCPPPGLFPSTRILARPPGLPRPDKDHPVEFKGEVYYDKPAVWPPPITTRRLERREKNILSLRAPDDVSITLLLCFKYD